MKKRFKGITLVELFIGLFISAIVFASIAFGIRVGVDLFSKTAAHSRIITGTRFTIDSFNSKIAPKLNIASEMKVLNIADMAAIPASSELEDNEYYLFLKDGSVTYRNSSGDTKLVGSEYISSLSFNLPFVTSAVPELSYFILKIILHAQDAEQPSAELNVTLDKALFNKFSREGSSFSGTGNVLYFVSSSYVKILNASDMESLSGKSLWTSTMILADYLVPENDGDIFWAVAKNEDDPTELVDNLSSPGYLKLFTTSGDVVVDNIINSHPTSGRHVRLAAHKDPQKYEISPYYLRYCVAERWSDAVKILPEGPSGIGRPYKAEDTEVFTGTGPGSSIQEQKEYLDQIIGDVSETFAKAKTEWTEHEGGNPKYQASYLVYDPLGDTNFASFVVSVLEDFNFSEFVDETEFFTVGLNTAKELVSISFKVDSYYYVIYKNGHVYQLTKNLILGEQENEASYVYSESTAKWRMMNDETFFTETWKDFQGMPPGRTDFLYRESLKNHTEIGWSRLDLMLLSSDLNYEYFTCREYNSSTKYDYGDIVFNPHDNMIYRRVRPSPSLKVEPHYQAKIIWNAITYVSNKVIMPDGTIQVPRDVIPYFSARNRFFGLGTLVKGSNGKTYMYAPSNNTVALSSWPTGEIVDRNKWVEVTEDIVKPDYVEAKYPSGEEEGEASNAGVAGNVNRPKKGRYYAHDGYLHLSTYDSNSLIQSLTQHPEFIPILNNKYRDTTYYDQGAVVWYEGKLYKALLSFYAESKAAHRPQDGVQTLYWIPYSRNLFSE